MVKVAGSEVEASNDMQLVCCERRVFYYHYFIIISLQNCVFFPLSNHNASIVLQGCWDCVQEEMENT